MLAAEPLRRRMTRTPAGWDAHPITGPDVAAAKAISAAAPRAVVEVRFLDFTYCDVADAWVELALAPAPLAAVKT